jgi:hypothetical protein
VTIFYYDVSSFQGQTQLPSDCSAIVAKATEGTYYRDSEYAWFKQQAANRNLPFSGYHFLKAEEDPAAQAAYYHNFAGNVPCMLDVETEGSSLPTVDQTLKFIDALHGLGGRVWGVYIPRWYWAQIGGNLGLLEAAGAVLISSNYTSYSDDGVGWQPYGGAKTITAWQFTSTPLDKNAFKGTQADLADIFNGTAGPVSSGVEVNLTDTVTFSPAVDQQFPDLGPEGFGGSTTIETVWLWTAARVAETLNKVNDLEAKLAALPSSGGAVLNAQQVADLVIAELKAKL